MHADAKQDWALAKAAYPDSIVFVAVDGIYFVAGADAETVRKTIRIETGSPSLGFDVHQAHIYMRQLAQRGYSVIKASAGHVTFVQPASDRRANLTRQRRMGRFVAVEPTRLFDRSELTCGVPTSSSREAPLFERLKAGFLADDTRGIRDCGAIYVVEIGDGFDVDESLTELPYSRILLLAAAAFATARKLPCQVVPPKYRRIGRVARNPAVVESKPIPVGQMGFGLLDENWRTD
jgi:hypothetical protein